MGEGGGAGEVGEVADDAVADRTADHPAGVKGLRLGSERRREPLHPNRRSARLALAASVGLRRDGGLDPRRSLAKQVRPRWCGPTRLELFTNFAAKTEVVRRKWPLCPTEG